MENKTDLGEMKSLNLFYRFKEKKSFRTVRRKCDEDNEEGKEKVGGEWADRWVLT